MSTSAQPSTPIAKLIERREVAENTMAFSFEKPSGWSFKPGQFVEVGLIDPPETDDEGSSRAFSIVSAPYQAAITIATRMRDTAFKRVLKSMPLGSEVKLDGPFGDLTLHNKASRPAVFLAGGIGITPFHSIVLNAAKEKLPHRIILFYSNRRPEDAPFLEELTAIQAKNPNYKLVACMTKMQSSERSWNGEAGLIDKQMLDRHLKDAASAEPIYYIAGPPQMVSALQTMLTSSGVDTDDIRIEEFAGY